MSTQISDRTPRPAKRLGPTSADSPNAPGEFVEEPDDDPATVPAWDGDESVIDDSAPQQVDPSDIAVAVDGASMVYRVRSGNEYNSAKTRLGRQFKRVTGAGWAEVHALDRLSFVVQRGESVGVIGTNGSGKSTLMKLLTGKIRATSGNVYATSTPIMLGVNAALVKQLSGRENIRLGCLAMGLTPEETKAKYEQIVELSGLRDSLHLPLKSYSSGMSSRLQFAIATAVDPDILLIDEALNTGDAQFRARTKRRLDEVRSQAGCVFLVSHSLGTIKQMCTRALWIEQGQLLADGDPEWVTSQYQEYTGHQANNRPRSAKIAYERTRMQLNPVSVDFLEGTRPHRASLSS